MSNKVPKYYLRMEFRCKKCGKEYLDTDISTNEVIKCPQCQSKDFEATIYRIKPN
jgi:DNA-directed RNA polymerase subunit RPC12/RpoP